MNHKNTSEAAVFAAFAIMAVVTSLVLVVIWISSEDNKLVRLCKNAGGIPDEKSNLCLHPSSVINID